jgi:hypothetical protein
LGFVEHNLIEGDQYFVFAGCKDIAPLPSHEICKGGKVKCAGYRKSIPNDTGYDDRVDGFFLGPFVGNTNQNSLRVGHFPRKYGSMGELNSRCWDSSFITERESRLNILDGGVAELVGIEGGVVSGVINLESSGVEASDWRPRHDEQYHEV